MELNKSKAGNLTNMNDINCELFQVYDFHREEISGGRLSNREQISSQKAMSLPTSPHEIRSRTSERSGNASDSIVNDDMVSAWYRVLESPMFNNKPLLPFQEWNIDFSELIVGTRVGIGTHFSSLFS